MLSIMWSKIEATAGWSYGAITIYIASADLSAGLILLGKCVYGKAYMK